MPKALFTKLIAQAAIGFFCILIGCSYGIYCHDRLFVIMSLLIGAFCIMRTISLYHLIQTKSYRTLTGTCIKCEPIILKKSQEIHFIDILGQEYYFSLDKTVKLVKGHHYRLFFRPNISCNSKKFDVNNSFASYDFLGFEEFYSQPKKEI